MAVFNTREILSNDESSFCENAESPASNTWTERLPVKNASFELTQTKLPDTAIMAYQNDRRPGYNGIRECKVSLTFPFYGHNTDATSSITETILYQLLQDGLGNGTTTAGDVVGSTPSVTDLQTTSVANSIVLVGTKGDGGGDCQPTIYSDTGGTVLVATPAVATAGHVVHGTMQVYPSESLTTTKRFLLGYTSSGEQYHAMGCQLSGLTISYPIAGEPEITLEYMGAYWGRGSETVPHGVSLPASNWAPVAGGSMFINTVGTATRATINPSTVELSIDLGLAANRSPGVNGTYQVVRSWERTQAKASLKVQIPKDTTYETLFGTDGSQATAKHIMFSSCASPGRITGFYLRNTYIAGSRPVPIDVDGLMYQEVTFEAREGQTTTTELTRSPFILFMA